MSVESEIAQAVDPDEGDEIVIGGKRYTTERGLARKLRKSPRTIGRWNALRIGPPRITIGRLVLYDVDRLPEWLAGHESGRERRSTRRR